MDTLPRTRASPEPMGHHRGLKPGRPPAFCSTLKLLAASVVPRRNVFTTINARRKARCDIMLAGGELVHEQDEAQVVGCRAFSGLPSCILTLVSSWQHH